MKSDLQLQHDVMDELEWEPSLDACRIDVNADGGVITLTGFVASYADKVTAERVAKRVYGVKAVANDVDIRIPAEQQRTDAQIAAAALSALQLDATLPSEQIKATVRNGSVTLEGSVDLYCQKEGAERLVRNLRGVKGVSNDIVLKTRPKAENVKQRIEAAFTRSAELDARRVSVQANNGKVILYGNVSSWAERQEAEQAAWAAPGVSEVENHLCVMP
jgi:osmotically-inducible protein OsmY